ncbi:calponin domain containing protein [Entamoeba histolytica HM-1:IMSS-B]|uniref:Alpha-actinin n=6 Tax=Entamoeba histolytica TaxID=5759 RepID=C4M561_ENTH1|nr:hypothetical protein EHI_178080 [Entamoeba histolytica HM-1:IMSS]EMD49135.1 alpha-actinin, putative [Entamoeba histolytica KU27]EMH76576.1 calponin domain containing protein [Entamoeba histolytica HM-1:IMSS-B]EMS17211.1 alpha-actinin, putative [Entamoeba histolytica HM-3:IMSS]ENY63733.1 alpha-actinin, putative [Entamoeba histolytica HM-1:IMSS-A]BAN38936.1 hypothetical protein [Entamoeba histolytica]|eukprot:XP_651499.1 hypothetical protein EHI_178080 [Entamoeba histolytica HM-1:IMSS]
MSNIVTGEEAVLMWSNMRANCYNLNVTDFGSCWNDGRVVTAIIHSLFPKEFDYNSMTFKEPLKDMQVAFDCLKKHGVIIYMEPQDFLMKKPDTKSVTLFAAELMKYSQGNYEGYDEKKFEEAKRKRLEEEKKEEEEAAKRKQDAIDALPKCTACGQPISVYAYEFCGYPYHDTCIKCNGCNKPLRFKALAVNEKPYCELCGRNAFQKMKADGWVPPEGVRGPVQTRIGTYTGEKKAPPPQTGKPVVKKEEPKPTTSKEPELISRKTVDSHKEGGFLIETIEEIIFDPAIGKKKKRTIKRKTAIKEEPKVETKAVDEDDEIKRLEEEQRKLEEEMKKEEEEQEAELRRLEEETRRQEEELKKMEAEDNDDDELARIEAELAKLKESDA